MLEIKRNLKGIGSRGGGRKGEKERNTGSGEYQVPDSCLVGEISENAPYR